MFYWIVSLGVVLIILCTLVIIFSTNWCDYKDNASSDIISSDDGSFDLELERIRDDIRNNYGVKKSYNAKKRKRVGEKMREILKDNPVYEESLDESEQDYGRALTEVEKVDLSWNKTKREKDWEQEFTEKLDMIACITSSDEITTSTDTI